MARKNTKKADLPRKRKSVQGQKGSRPGILPTGNTGGYTAYEALPPKLHDRQETELRKEEVDEKEASDPREKYMSLGDHLEELRRRLLWILGILVVVSSVAGTFIEEIHSFLIAPYREVASHVASMQDIPGAGHLILGSVYGALEIYFKVAMMIGFIITLPIALTLLWGFITPAVSKRIARIGHLAVASSTLLFWTGVVFSWLYVFPLSLRMMLDTFLPDGVIAQTSLEKYYSFMFMIVLGSGLTFQLPMVVVILGAIGIISTAWHKRVWRYVIIGILLFAGFITPPDPFSIFALAVPLIVLYVLSVGIVWMIEKSRRRRRLAEAG